MKISLWFIVGLLSLSHADNFLYPTDTTVFDWGDSTYAMISVQQRQGRIGNYRLSLCYPGRPDFECTTLYASTDPFQGIYKFWFRLPPPKPYAYAYLNWYYEGAEVATIKITMRDNTSIFAVRGMVKRKGNVPVSWRDLLGRLHVQSPLGPITLRSRAAI